MERDILDRIEEAALNAWPAPRQMLYDGWLLRFTGGSSKRINSVNVRYSSKLPLGEKIAFCEGVYDRLDLPLLFRLPEPFTSPDIHQALSDAGWVTFDPTFVLGRAVTPEARDLPSNVRVQHFPLDAWLQLRAQLSDTPLFHWKIYETILDVIVPEKTLMGLFVDDEPVASGMGVVEGNLMGFFSIYTDQHFRRCGYAKAMMAALTHWGAERGATFGYLQVEGDNEPALALYRKLGFEQVYQYWYCKK